MIRAGRNNLLPRSSAKALRSTSLVVFGCPFAHQAEAGDADHAEHDQAVGDNR